MISELELGKKTLETQEMEKNQEMEKIARRENRKISGRN